MNGLLLLQLGFRMVATPMRPDTPPPLPVPVAQLEQLKTMQDVIAASLPALDSLALGALRVAWFRPALIGSDSVGIWVPYPALVPSYAQLTAAMSAADVDKTQTPTATPFDQAPSVLNRNQVEAAIVRIVYEADPRVREFNERMARSQSVGGTAQLWIYINAAGTVERSVVKKTSGNADLDNSAQQIAMMMRFSPARNKGEAVAVWIEVPIKFRAR